MPRQIAEHRHLALERRPGERELERVALGLAPVGARIGLRAVGSRVEVGAAGEDERVERSSSASGIGGPGVVGRQEQRQPAGLVDRARVRALGDVDLDVVPDGPVARSIAAQIPITGRRPITAARSPGSAPSR